MKGREEEWVTGREQEEKKWKRSDEETRKWQII
jgi:hypothetical protein